MSEPGVISSSGPLAWIALSIGEQRTTWILIIISIYAIWNPKPLENLKFRLEWTGKDLSGLEWTGTDEKTGAYWIGLEQTGGDWCGLQQTGADWSRLEWLWRGCRCSIDSCSSVHRRVAGFCDIFMANLHAGETDVTFHLWKYVGLMIKKKVSAEVVTDQSNKGIVFFFIFEGILSLVEPQLCHRCWCASENFVTTLQDGVSLWIDPNPNPEDSPLWLSIVFSVSNKKWTTEWVLRVAGLLVRFHIHDATQWQCLKRGREAGLHFLIKFTKQCT